jgi:hypothetical protein
VMLGIDARISTIVFAPFILHSGHHRHQRLATTDQTIPGSQPQGRRPRNGVCCRTLRGRPRDPADQYRGQNDWSSRCPRGGAQSRHAQGYAAGTHPRFADLEHDERWNGCHPDPCWPIDADRSI